MILRQAILIFAKDLRMEVREAHHLFSILLFGVLLLLLFSFALSVDPDLMRRMAPGLFWMAILFTSLLSLERSFDPETQDGQWDGLLLMGTDPKSIYLGKCLVNFVHSLVLQAVFLPLMAVLFDLNLAWSLAIVLVLGGLGMSTVGTLYAGLTASLGKGAEGRALLPLLLFPMLVPVLLCSVKMTELALARDVFQQQVAWMKLLIVFDMIFFLGSLLCADFLFDPS